MVLQNYHISSSGGGSSSSSPHRRVYPHFGDDEVAPAAAAAVAVAESTMIPAATATATATAVSVPAIPIPGIPARPSSHDDSDSFVIQSVSGNWTTAYDPTIHSTEATAATATATASSSPSIMAYGQPQEQQQPPYATATATATATPTATATATADVQEVVITAVEHEHPVEATAAVASAFPHPQDSSSNSLLIPDNPHVHPAATATATAAPEISFRHHTFPQENHAILEHQDGSSSSSFRQRSGVGVGVGGDVLVLGQHQQQQQQHSSSYPSTNTSTSTSIESAMPVVPMSMSTSLPTFAATATATAATPAPAVVVAIDDHDYHRHALPPPPSAEPTIRSTSAPSAQQTSSIATATASPNHIMAQTTTTTSTPSRSLRWINNDSSDIERGRSWSTPTLGDGSGGGGGGVAAALHHAIEATPAITSPSSSGGGGGVTVASPSSITTTTSSSSRGSKTKKSRRERAKNMNLLHVFLGGGGGAGRQNTSPTPGAAGATGQDKPLHEVAVIDSILERRLLKWYFVDPTGSATGRGTAAAGSTTWNVIINMDQKAIENNDSKLAASTARFYSCASQREAHELALALAPPQMRLPHQAGGGGADKTCNICESTKHSPLIQKQYRRGSSSFFMNCRNCGVCVCKGCTVMWPKEMFPDTYRVKKDKEGIVCKSCDWLSTAFRGALLDGNYEYAEHLYATGNVNLRSPFGNTKGELLYPVHCAALGKSSPMRLLRWLVDVHFCPVMDKQKQPILSSEGRSVLSIAMKRQQLDMMEYLVVEKSMSVFSVRDLKAALSAVDALLRHHNRIATSSSTTGMFSSSLPSPTRVSTTAPTRNEEKEEDDTQQAIAESHPGAIFEPEWHQPDPGQDVVPINEGMIRVLRESTRVSPPPPQQQQQGEGTEQPEPPSTTPANELTNDENGTQEIVEQPESVDVSNTDASLIVPSSTVTVAEHVDEEAPPSPASDDHGEPGSSRIDEDTSGVPPVSPESEGYSQDNGIESNEDTSNDMLLAIDPCYFCSKHSKDCVIVPCGHQLCCMQCSETLGNKCPACNVECTFKHVFRLTSQEEAEDMQRALTASIQNLVCPVSLPEPLQGDASEDAVEWKEDSAEDLLLAQDPCMCCVENPKNCAILPCGHLICCMQCSEKLNKCPICNLDEITFLQVFRMMPVARHHPGHHNSSSSMMDANEQKEDDDMRRAIAASKNDYRCTDLTEEEQVERAIAESARESARDLQRIL